MNIIFSLHSFITQISRSLTPAQLSVVNYLLCNIANGSKKLIGLNSIISPSNHETYQSTLHSILFPYQILEFIGIVRNHMPYHWSIIIKRFVIKRVEFCEYYLRCTLKAFETGLYYISRLTRVKRLGLHRYDMRWPVLQHPPRRLRDTAALYRDIKTVGDTLSVNETTEAAWKCNWNYVWP